MAWVLSERDYKLVTLFSKVAGIFTFAAGTVVVVDHHNVWAGIGLVLLGAFVTLAPVPMTVMRPDSYPPDDEDGTLSVTE